MLKNRNFVENRNFGWKIKILVKNRNFCQKSELWWNISIFGEKSEFWWNFKFLIIEWNYGQTFELLLKNLYSGKTSKWEIETLVKNINTRILTTYCNFTTSIFFLRKFIVKKFKIFGQKLKKFHVSGISFGWNSVVELAPSIMWTSMTAYFQANEIEAMYKLDPIVRKMVPQNAITVCKIFGSPKTEIPPIRTTTTTNKIPTKSNPRKFREQKV